MAPDPELSVPPLAGPTPGPLVAVDDPTDPRLADYRDLRDPAGRHRYETDQGVFMVEGRVAVRRLVQSPYPVASLLVDDHQATAAADLVDAVRVLGAPVYVGSRPVIAATVGFPLHRGVVAAARRLPQPTPDQIIETALRRRRSGCGAVLGVLEGLNDHENIGAVFRNAAAFAVDGILLDPSCADPLYRRSVRVSAGHVLTTPFSRLTPWPDALGRLQAAGFVVVALAPEHSAPADANCQSARLTSVRSIGAITATTGSSPSVPPDVAVLFGAEGAGLSAAALRRADRIGSIPMAPTVDSLNVATAAAITFYELANRTG